MGDVLLGASQSTLILTQPKLNIRLYPTITATSHQLSSRRHFNPLAAVISSSDSPTITSLNAVISSKDDLDTGDGGGDGGGDFGGRGGGGGGGGGGRDGGDGGWRSESEESGGESEDNKKKIGLSLSQKLTLGFAAIVGVGGIMGFMKSGSQMSLIAGGLSAAALYYVFTELPLRPVFASSIGIGVSAMLVGVMGSRFKSSGKIFPAGIVSLASLIMAGGYVHGIIRTIMH